ncbi:glycosyltransferase family 4 protein [Paenibacillus sp. 1011MAR3C5]|uniref:glycosyltransferase family 4 protein n=1 Tax=Paenibacillus sp. 1011MAR3C5 TaxID=1675787 RepID=UPI000E6D4531|nr:glycosyltransferase family 4 protein [Paenibacillus sp. 1011MAR3C5]RJE83620.1 glycosyltransferase family 4 protein [Paenibacillus sp. 1011MAR3C5]
MSILHICSYYISSKLYKNLVNELSSQRITTQHIFVPVKDEKQLGLHQISNHNVHFYYRHMLRKWDRFLYFHKIKKQMKEVERSILLNQKIDFIHAHTVFSDGGTAYKLHQKYGVKYIVTIRNTDINKFYKYGYHLRPFMHKILLNSSAIIFISHAYKKQMLRLIPEKIANQIAEKIQVVPNGIDQYWIENVVKQPRQLSNDQLKLIFIGNIDKNKNVHNIIYAMSKYKQHGGQITLDIVGTGPCLIEVMEIVTKLGLTEEVKHHGYISDKNAVLEILTSCDIFIMPSYNETFGLVYIEALSQGLPIIYSKDQGVDGFFDRDPVGVAVDPSKVQDIVGAFSTIKSQYYEMSNNAIEQSRKFNWPSLAKEFIEIYKNKV